MYTLTMRHLRANVVASEKVLSITYSEYIFLALGIQHAMWMCYNDACDLSDPRIFFHVSQKRYDFKKKSLIRKYVLIISTSLPETFLILRRTERDVFIKVIISSWKYQFSLSDFNEAWTISKDMVKIPRYQMSWKSVHWEQSCSMRTDSRQTERERERQTTDRHDEVNGRFLQVCEPT